MCAADQNMKLIAILLAGVMVCSCFAAPRRALMSEMQGKERLLTESSRVSVPAEIEFMKEKESFGHPDSSSIYNHHNIPRQDYNQWGSNSNNNDGDGDKDGSG